MKVTSTNLYVLKELFKSSDRIQNRVDEVYYRHLNRLLKARYIKVIDKHWLELTDLGKEAIHKNPAVGPSMIHIDQAAFSDTGEFSRLVVEAGQGSRIDFEDLKDRSLSEQIYAKVEDWLFEWTKYEPDMGDYIVGIKNIRASWVPEFGLNYTEVYTYTFDVEWDQMEAVVWR